MKNKTELSPLMPDTESGNYHTHKHHIFHTRFKVIVAVLIILIIAAGIFSCHAFKDKKISSSDLSQLSVSADVDEGQNSQESSENKASVSDKHKDNSSKKTDDIGKTQQLGAENYGFITVPDTWKTFNDTDISSVTGNTVKQYCDESGKLIITLNCTENAQTDAKSAASSCWAQMEQDGAADIQGATVQLANCEAYQVYGYYTDDDVMLVIWVFTDSGNILHYISAEGPIDNVMNAVTLVEETFTLTAD